MPSEHFLDLLTGPPFWRARCEDYDLIQGITFARDGTGTMTYGQDQRIHTYLDFTFLAADGELRFEYLSTRREPWGETFRRDGSNGSGRSRCLLLRERVVLRVPHHRVDFQYEWILRFSSDPFPQGWRPPGDPVLDYLGDLTHLERP